MVRPRQTFFSIKNRLQLIAISLLAMACAKQPDEDVNEVSLGSFVNTFIGTDGKGNTYPGATVPYGMVQLSPDNGRSGWDWISGYFYPDSIISGFSHLHLSGTGAGDLYDISFLPVSGQLKERHLNGEGSSATVSSSFSHNRESSYPGYYQVYLDDYGVDVALTTTERTGLQRYQFEGEDYRVRLHLGYTRNWDGITESYIKIVNDSTIAGYRRSSGWARDQHVYFQSVFSSPFTYQLSDADATVPSDSVSGKNLLAELSFAQADVMVKTGISSVSTDNAALNLQREQPGFDFEKVRQAAAEKWEDAFQKVVVKASPDDMTQFYTAMYHSMLAPTLYSDVNGQYRGTDGKIWTAKGNPRYTTYSLWDTYRALHPWLTISQQERVPGLINSLFDFYDENGLLPVWNLWGGETNMMIGYHAVPVIADAIAKDLPGLDKERAYQAVKQSAMQDREEVAAYRDYGYVPFETSSWNVSKTLEYAYDDWCIAQLAASLGKEDDYNHFIKRSKSYHNHFDEQTGFFRAKSKEGHFKETFDPLAYHPEDYCEANAWQYLWYVPHDVEGLLHLMGGKEVFEEKLDEVFETQQSGAASPDWISGFIGQYVHGNEPSHHVPYLYQYAGAGKKTQLRVRQVMDQLYQPTPGGLAGNEDCGQMSAWYLFSALGFYPVNPASGEYVLGSPEVYEASIRLPQGQNFKIIARNQSPENVYVESVALNGKELDGFVLTHEQIMNGGELVFEMTSHPVDD